MIKERPNQKYLNDDAGKVETSQLAQSQDQVPIFRKAHTGHELTTQEKILV